MTGVGKGFGGVCLGSKIAPIFYNTKEDSGALPINLDVSQMNMGDVIELRPGDGIIHSWLNRMLLPDTVGTGGDSHTRFPIGISFPAGSGLVAFGAATGVMPLDMPESVLVRFKGKMQPGVTLRDLVNAIPLYAIKAGLMTVAKQGKKMRAPSTAASMPCRPGSPTRNCWSAILTPNTLP